MQVDLCDHLGVWFNMIGSQTLNGISGGKSLWDTHLGVQFNMIGSQTSIGISLWDTPANYALIDFLWPMY